MAPNHRRVSLIDEYRRQRACPTEPTCGARPCEHRSARMRVEVFVALCAALTVAVFSCTTEPRQPRLDHVKISITPNVQSFPVNDTARVHVLGFAENGVLYLLTSIRWSCTDSSIIQIDSTDPLDAHL